MMAALGRRQEEVEWFRVRWRTEEPLLDRYVVHNTVWANNVGERLDAFQLDLGGTIRLG